MGACSAKPDKGGDLAAILTIGTGAALTVTVEIGPDFSAFPSVQVCSRPGVTPATADPAPAHPPADGASHRPDPGPAAGLCIVVHNDEGRGAPRRQAHPHAPRGRLDACGHEREPPAFTHRTKPGRVTVPHPNRDIPRGTAASIYRQAGWNP